MTQPGKAVLFDLGNTLAAYYRPDQFGPILEQSVESALAELGRQGIRAPDFNTALTAAHRENREAADFRFSPMEQRLARIFEISASEHAELLKDLCECFLAPIFAVGRVYDDTLPVLADLRRAGYLTAIVSNAPWGSPPQLWRDRLREMGLVQVVTEVILCGDVGWRKPAPTIFRHSASTLGVRCEECVFVGDELQWDVAGSTAVGMRSVLIDRDDIHPTYEGSRIRSLYELQELLP
jgi:putative hydrolase of the HAD superfamily